MVLVDTDDATLAEEVEEIVKSEALRGRAIARALPRAAMVEWGMIMRTAAIDRLIDEAIKAGVDTVMNLGAGLDIDFPYGLVLRALPKSMREKILSLSGAVAMQAAR